jgi:hypothetical protein
VADPERVLAPPVDLGRGRSPENVVEEYIAETALSGWCINREKKKPTKPH